MTPREAASIARGVVAARGAERRRLLRRAARPEVVAELKRLVDTAMGSDCRAALRIATLAHRAGQHSREPQALAIGSHTLGNANHIAGRHAEAALHYRSASQLYRKLGQDSERTKVEIALIGVLARLGQFARATRIAKGTERRLRASGDEVAVAKLSLNQANLCVERDRHEEAIRLLSRARPVLAEAGLQALVAHADLNLANSQSTLANFAHSGALYARARERYEALGQLEMVALVDYNWAYDDFLQGRVHDARSKLAAARDRFRGSRVDGLAHASQDEAELCLLLGLNQRAIEAAAEARRSFRDASEPLACARATVIEARAALALGDDATAARCLADASRTFRALRHTAGLGEAELLAARIESYPLSFRRRAARRAATRFELLHRVDRQAAAITQTAQLELEAGRSANARKAFVTARTIARRRGFSDIEMRAEHGLARTAERAGRPGSSLRHYRRSLAAYERLRADVRADGDRLALASSRQPMFVDAIRAALNQNRIAEAFSFVERARARALVDLLAVDERFVAAAMAGDGALERRLRALKRELSNVEARSQRSERRLDSISRTSVESSTVAAKLQDLLGKLGRRHPETSYALAGYPTIRIDDLRTVLGERALVTYFVDHDEVGALIVTAKQVTARRGFASLRAIDSSLHTLRFTIDAMRTRSTFGADSRLHAATAALTTLGSLLIAPIEADIGERSLVVVPHALLHHVPFPALYRRGVPLAHQREVSLSPSATVLAHAIRRPVASGRALVIAAPDLLAPSIWREAERVARALGATLLEGDQATAPNLRREAQQVAVAHFASHGVYEPDAPLLSGLALADGRLTAPEIASLGLSAELVTLAACDSARGSASGDEVLGLTRSFLQAGTRALMSSLWAIDDDATADFMIAFYQEIARGCGVAAAHRSALLAAKTERPHPYFWAPFLVTGAWQPLHWKPHPRTDSEETP